MRCRDVAVLIQMRLQWDGKREGRLQGLGDSNREVGEVGVLGTR